MNVYDWLLQSNVPLVLYNWKCLLYFSWTLHDTNNSIFDFIQIIHGSSQPGFCYIVDTIVRNGGFPLSDCFHCINRYCLIYINAFKSKLKVTSQVVYDKAIFFASKCKFIILFSYSFIPFLIALIESTAKSGLTDYFTDLGKYWIYLVFIFIYYFYNVYISWHDLIDLVLF